MTRESNADGLEYLLDLHLSKIGYDNGYWVTMRIVEIAPDSGRPFGVQYSLTLHDGKDDRVLGFDNSHSMDIATGPARKSKRPDAFDHIDRRGRNSIPYKFTTPYKLIEDFFVAVDEVLKQEGML